MRAYQAQVRAFEQWAGHEAGLANVNEVCRYLATRAAHSHSSRTQFLAALRKALRESGRADITAHPTIRQTLRGLRRQRPQAPAQAAPFLQETLDAIERTACLPRIGRGGKTESAQAAAKRGRVDIAFARTLRDSLCRVSELLRVRWIDVAYDADGSGILILRGPTKADQSGTQVHALYLTPRTVEAIDRMRPADANDIDRVFPFSVRTANRRIKAAIKAAGLPHSESYSSHSGRVGAAQSLAAAGAGIVEIQTAGRWNSPAMPAAYARKQLAKRGAVAKYLA